MEVVIVTGAGSGIGLDCARFLSQSGYHCVAGVRKARDRDSSPATQAVLLDVTNDGQVNDAVAELRGLLGSASRVHLVNNAGIAVAGPVESVSLARWREQLDVNVLGLVRATQAFLPWIRATAGTVVNISSVSGKVAYPFLGPYAASKFAVEAISDSLRRELLPFGARVAIVEPGPVDTPIWGKGLTPKEDVTEGMTPGLSEVYGRAMTRFQAIVRQSAEDAVPARMVSAVVLRALRAKKPRTRYIVGSPAVTMQASVASLLPDHWLDSLIDKEIRKD